MAVSRSKEVKKPVLPTVPADPLAEIQRKANSLEGLITLDASKGVFRPRRFQDVQGKMAFGKAITACLEKGVLKNVLPEPQLEVLEMTKGANMLNVPDAVTVLKLKYKIDEDTARFHIDSLKRVGAIDVDPTGTVLGRAACIAFEGISSDIISYKQEAGVFAQISLDSLGEQPVFDFSKPVGEMYLTCYGFGLKYVNVMVENWLIRPVEETQTSAKFELTDLGSYFVKHFIACPLPATFGPYFDGMKSNVEEGNFAYVVDLTGDSSHSCSSLVGLYALDLLAMKEAWQWVAEELRVLARYSYNQEARQHAAKFTLNLSPEYLHSLAAAGKIDDIAGLGILAADYKTGKLIVDELCSRHAVTGLARISLYKQKLAGLDKGDKEIEDYSTAKLREILGTKDVNCLIKNNDWRILEGIGYLVADAAIGNYIIDKFMKRQRNNGLGSASEIAKRSDAAEIALYTISKLVEMAKKEPGCIPRIAEIGNGTEFPEVRERAREACETLVGESTVSLGSWLTESRVGRTPVIGSGDVFPEADTIELINLLGDSESGRRIVEHCLERNLSKGRSEIWDFAAKTTSSVIGFRALGMANKDEGILIIKFIALNTPLPDVGKQAVDHLLHLAKLMYSLKVQAVILREIRQNAKCEQVREYAKQI